MKPKDINPYDLSQVGQLKKKVKPKDISPYDLSQVGQLEKKEIKLRIKVPLDPYCTFSSLRSIN